MLAKELKANTPIPEIILEITSKGEVRKFASEKGSGTVCTCAGKDEKGDEVSVTLWNDQCNMVEEGDTIVVKSGWCSEYKGNKQVSAGKMGTLEVRK